MKYVLFILTLCLQLNCSHASKRIPSSEELGQLEDSDSLSQLIRSNSKHYWGWAKTNEHKYENIKDALQYTGLVFGDPHMGNFAPSLVKSKSGESRIQFVPVDFDDAGEAPFVLDLARFVIAVESVDKKSIKKTAMIEAYIYGLNHPHQDLTPLLPELVQAKLNTSVDTVLDLQKKYVDKKTSKGKFKIEANSTKIYNGEFLEPIKKNLIPLTTLDIVQRVVLRGGSKDALRLWALTKNNKSGLIYEFKEWQQTGTHAYSPQAAIKERLQDIYNIFWPGLDSTSYKIVPLNDVLFWIREKHETLLDIPYSVNSDAERAFVATYAAACAAALGQIHGRQKSGQDFAQYIQKIKSIGLKNTVDPIATDYLHLMEEYFNK